MLDTSKRYRHLDRLKHVYKIGVKSETEQTELTWREREEGRCLGYGIVTLTASSAGGGRTLYCGPIDQR